MYLSIGEKAKECGVSVATLRRWDKRGLLKPDIITAGGHRRYKKTGCSLCQSFFL